MFEDLSGRINQLPKLTPAEKKLVEYFQKAKEQIALVSIYQISEGAGVSVATVTRFVSRLGYADFNEFKKKNRRELLNQVGSQWEKYQLVRDQLLSGDEDLWSRFSKLVINDLKSAHANISSQKMQEVAKLIANTKGRVYVMGQLNSYIIAHLFWQQLVLLRPGAIFLNNQSGNLVHYLLDVKKDDILFAVTYSAYAHQTTLTVQEFADRGCEIVILTDSDVSPVSKWATIQLVVPVEWNALLGSRCSGLMVVECLALYLAQLNKSILRKRINSTQDLTVKFETFTNRENRRHFLLGKNVVWRRDDDMDDKS